MSVTAALGFVASGMHAGIKRAKPDLALIATDDGKSVACAAVFTTNTFAAPPIDACRERGLLVLSAGPDVLRLTPPLVVDAGQVAEALAILEGVLAP